jgi:4-hydroxy-tetrahydrodipicolinate reductase
MAIKLVISGCCGRMGRSIALLAAKDATFTLAGAMEAAGHDALGRDLGLAIGHPTDLGVRVVSDARAAMSTGDVVIEFTTPDVTIAHAQLARD